MDRWIHLGLLGTWFLFALVFLIWWRRRRPARRYPFSERATVILAALHQTADMGIIYWSKSEKKFQKRIVTPLELDGYSLKAFDHTRNEVRIFKVTRLRDAVIIPKGTRTFPRIKSESGSRWALVGFGGAALALLAFTLLRDRLPGGQSGVSSDARRSASATVTTTSSPSAEPGVPLKLESPQGNSATNAAVADKAVTIWEIVVEDSPEYEMSRAAEVLQQVLGCSASEEQELVEQLRSQGRATVWSGPRTNAERRRQEFEAEGFVVNLQPAAQK